MNFISCLALLSTLGSAVLVPKISLAFEETRPTLELIEGGSSISGEKNKHKREIHVGDLIEYGEKLITPESVSAVLTFPNRSKMIIAPLSSFTIEEYEGGIYWNRLKEGAVRGVIKKSKYESPPMKFLIRTKTTVLGVRGTDFVMSFAAGKNVAEVHTLEGTVEVAKDQLNLLKNNGLPVKEGEFIQSSYQGVSSPQPFNSAQFLQSLDPSFSAAGQTVTGQPIPPVATAPNPAGGPAVAGGSNYFGAGPSTFSPSSGNASFHAPSTSGGDSSPRPNPTAPPSEPNAAPTPAAAPPPSSSPTSSVFPPPDKESKSFKLLTFQTGLFFTRVNSLENYYLRAAHFAWTPMFRLPVFNMLWIKASVAANFARDGSLYSQFLIREYQLHLVLSFFNFAYAEVGGGYQSWANEPYYESLIASVGLGFNLSIPILDRIWIAAQVTRLGLAMPEVKAGIGLTAF